MKKKLSFLLLLTVLVLAFALSGCTESYKQAAIPGNYDSLVIDTEGGLATKVTMGDTSYLYFVNGVAGQTAEENTFGSVVKGAIARVALKSDGSPDLSTKTIIVPKNVFATEVDSSFVIRAGYIYYTSPSIVKDKEGKAKTGEMVLMRTSLDGTKTEVIKTFTTDDGGFSNIYRVTEKEIVYYYANAFYRIDLSSKKFESTKIVDKVSAYKYVKGAEYAVYTVTPEDSDYANQVRLLPFSATSADGTKVLIDIASYDKATLEHEDGYQITLTAAQGNADQLKLFYTKTDSGTNKLSAGIYLYQFDLKNGFNAESRYEFDRQNEQRITAGASAKAYTAFNFISDTEMYATHSAGLDFLVKDKVETPGFTLNWKVLQKEQADGSKDTANITVAATFLKYVQTETEGTIYYFNGTSLQRRTVFSVANGEKTIVLNDSENLYTLTATTSWLNYQLIGNQFYFINSGVNGYVYYVDISTFEPILSSSAKKVYSNTLLSIMTQADKIALMTVKTTD